MNSLPEGDAIVYCQGAFGTLNGKTAHGLVRRTNRYRVLSVIDSRLAGEDAGSILDGRPKGILIYRGIQEALGAIRATGNNPTYFVIGLTPDGGRLSREGHQDVLEAIRSGLNVDSGLHDFLSEDNEISDLARAHVVRIRDVRKTPPRKELHFFKGKIEEVTSLKVAVLGTDSAVGKRTTAWILLDALQAAGYSAEMIGTGQTSWMQGVRYGIILDSLINDFVSGEIEHAVWTAWQEVRPDVIIIEGQGSLMNPAYPGGFEILAAGRPDVVILQHAPARKDYDGFPGYPVHPLEKQIEAVELISGKPVVAVTVNRENLTAAEVPNACAAISEATGLPSIEVLLNGGDQIVEVLRPFLKR
ncbi:MAG: DUF1611 domain-containing protein [Desulfobacteraceae bacterium]|nr:MAG: DUF1611 domain-containing protein [Desulfobacteraceae bacterium]